MIRTLFFFICITTFSIHGKEIANQSHQNLEHMPSLTTTQVIRAPLVIATVESLAGYGRLVTNYDAEEVILESWPLSGSRPLVEGTGIGPVIEGSFEMTRKGNIFYASNGALDRHYITGWFDDPSIADESTHPSSLDRVYVHEANYHPDGGQVFYPKDNTPFIALLALPTNDVTPEDFVAFYFDGTCGVQINPNVWHQPMYPTTDHASFYDKQGSVHGCVSVDFVTEFNTYVEIPLPK